MKNWCAFLAGIGSWGAATTVMAQGAGGLADRYSLVGVIAASEQDQASSNKSSKGQNQETSKGQQSVALIKDRQARNSIVLKEGEALKGYPSLKVVEIGQKEVLLSDGRRQVKLTRDAFPSEDSGSSGGPSFTDTSADHQMPYGQGAYDDMPPPPPPPPGAPPYFGGPGNGDDYGDFDYYPPPDDGSGFDMPPPMHDMPPPGYAPPGSGGWETSGDMPGGGGDWAPPGLPQPY